jgi:phage tail-like protein
MSNLFTVNTTRFNPYPSFAFLLYFGTTAQPVAGVTKISALKRSSKVIEYNEGGYNITCERGLTWDRAFQEWADAAQVLDKGAPGSSLANLRREIRIELLNEVGQTVFRVTLHKAWVSEYQALSALDAGGNAVAIETLKMEHEGWEMDTSLAEQKES